MTDISMETFVDRTTMDSSSSYVDKIVWDIMGEDLNVKQYMSNITSTMDLYNYLVQLMDVIKVKPMRTQYQGCGWDGNISDTLLDEDICQWILFLKTHNGNFCLHGSRNDKIIDFSMARLQKKEPILECRENNCKIYVSPDESDKRYQFLRFGEDVAIREHREGNAEKEKMCLWFDEQRFIIHNFSFVFG